MNREEQLNRKIDLGVIMIRRVMAQFHSPAVMSSFGKDSIVLLYLVRCTETNLPVIYHRDPWQPQRHSFANQVIEDWNLTVHDWPPAAMGIKCNEDRLELVARYQSSPGADFIDIPKNVYETPNDAMACGLDIIKRPVGAMVKMPWDAYLIGHKSSDVDQYYGRIPLHLDIKLGSPSAPALVYPLRDWTDEDIWDVIQARDLPWQKNRYAEDRIEFEDKTFNNDYVKCCARCIDPRNHGTVMCPKLGCEIDVIADTIPMFNYSPTYFGDKLTPCDARLKDNIVYVGYSPSGIPIAQFNYIGSPRRYEGVIAQDVKRVCPHAVVEYNGMLTVIYAQIDVELRLLSDPRKKPKTEASPLGAHL